MNRWLPGLILAGLFGLCALMFFAMFEWKEYETGGRPTLEAQRNDYLALELFWEKMGYEVETVDVWTSDMELPPEGVTMVLLSDRRKLSPQRHQALLDWVEKGNGLIAFLPDPQADTSFEDGYHLWEDPLLAPVEGELTSIEDDIQDVTVTYSMGEVLDLKLKQKGRMYYNEELSLFENEDNLKAFMTAYNYGEGMVLLLADNEIFDNSRLEQADHAYFAYKCANYFDHKNLLLVQKVAYQSIWTLIWERGRPAIIGLVVMIVMGLWLRMPRFGPMIPNPSLARRSLMEHIGAFARFYVNHGQGEILVKATQEALTEQMRRRRPEWLKLDQPILEEQLAELSGLELSEVQLAFAGYNSASDQFSTKIQYLEKMRRSL